MSLVARAGAAIVLGVAVCAVAGCIQVGHSAEIGCFVDPNEPGCPQAASIGDAAFVEPDGTVNNDDGGADLSVDAGDSGSTSSDSSADGSDSGSAGFDAGDSSADGSDSGSAESDAGDSSADGAG